MAYFENLAADLDLAQHSKDFASLIPTTARVASLPFAIVKQVAEVPSWPDIKDVEEPKTTYIAWLRTLFDGGVDFYPADDDCCELAEQFLVESLRAAQGLPTLAPHYMNVLEPSESIIFTHQGEAVGYKKSHGAPTTYGLRDVPRHGVWAGVISIHDFNDARVAGEAGDVLVCELDGSDSFTSLRPATTTLDLQARASLTSYGLLSPLQRETLPLTHHRVVGIVDAMLTATKQRTKSKTLQHS